MAPSSLFLKAATLAVAGLSSGVLAVTQLPYVVDDTYQGNGFDGTGFFDLFNFNTANDPNGGYVDYQDSAAAFGNLNLASVNGYGQAFIGVDHATYYNGTNARGRPALRLESKKLYNGGLFIADIAHMPGSICGVWPAFWTAGLPPNYPAHGEIDIIENINENTYNLETLHTNANCNITNSLQMGTPQDDGVCDNNFQDGTKQYLNQGCSVKDDNSTNQPSYGSPFNDVGGGVYAMEWTSSTIKIWNFPRGNVPADIAGGTPDPSLWNPPTLIAGDSCDVSQHFQDHSMIFDTTFCGSYAGQPALWAQTTCAKAGWADCQSYVAANPNAFEQAYWLVNYVKVYQRKAVTTTSTTMSSTTTSSATATATGPIHVPSAGPYNWIGCQTEASFTRALNSSTLVDYVHMTVEMCEAFCSSPTQYKYFGVEYSGECYCGDVLEPGSARAPTMECNMVCDGSPNEYCGGSDRLDLYQLHGVYQTTTTTTSSTTTSSSSTTTSPTSTTTSSSSTTTSSSSSSSSTSSSSSSSSSTSSTTSSSSSSTSSTSSSSSSSTSSTTSSSSSSTSSTTSSTSTKPTTSSSSSSSSSSTSSTSKTSTTSSSSSSSSTSTSSSSSSSSSKISSTSTTSTSSSSSSSSSSTSSISSSMSSSTTSSSTQTKPTSSSSSSSSSSTSQTKPTSTTSSSSLNSTSSSSSPSSSMSITSSMAPYSNSSTSSMPMTTSTVYTTATYTITKCPETVTSCPARSTMIVTSTIALYTTVCPVSAVTTPSSTTTPSSAAPESTTSTVYTTAYITVTQCPATITNCPAHSTKVYTSTYALYTTVCPVSNKPSPAISSPAKTASPPAVTVVTIPVIPVSSMPYAAGNSTKPASGTGALSKPASLPSSIAVQSSPSGPTAKPSNYKTSNAQAGNAGGSMVALLMVAVAGMLML